MMKALRISAIILGVLAVAILLTLVVLLSSSGLQKWALLKALNAQEGVTARVEHVDFGLNGLELREFQMLSQKGPSVLAADLELRTSITKALFSKELHLDLLRGRGVVVDLTRLDEDSEDDDEESVFEGIFEPLRDAGYTLHIGEVDFEARIELPQQQHVELRMTGGGIAPGSDGPLLVESQLVTSPEVVPGLDAVTTQTRIFINQDDRGPTAVRILGETVPSGAQVPQGSRVLTSLDARVLENGAEAYQAHIETAGSRILALAASYEPDTELIDYTFNLDIPESLMGDLGLQALVNPFSLRGEGSGQLDPEKGTAHLMGGIVGSFVPITEEGSRLAPIEFDINWDAALREDHVVIATLVVRAGVEGATAINLLVPQPLKISLEDPLASLEADSHLFQLDLDMPLMGMVPSLVRTGRVTGQLSIVTRNGALLIENPAPLQVSELVIALPGREELGSLAITVSPTLRLDRESLRFSINGIRAEREGTPFVQGSLNGAADYALGGERPEVVDINIEGQLQANLDSIYAILLPAEEDPGQQGNLDLAFNARLADVEGALEAGAQIQLSGVSLRDTGTGVDSLSLRPSISRSPQGRVSADVPVTIRGTAGESDVRLQASVDSARQGSGAPLQLDALVEGNQLFVDDLMALASAFAMPASETEEATPEEPAGEHRDRPDEEPIWAGIAGKASAQLARVVVGANQIQNVQAQLDISETAIDLSQFQASLGGDPIQAQFKLAFSEGPRPYKLESQLQLNDFDVSQIEGMSDQLVSGIFDLSATFGGTGPNLQTIPEWLEGRVELQAQQALFRPLGSSSGTANLVGALGGVLSGVLQQKGEQGYAAATQELTKLLQGIETDHLQVKAELQEGMDVNLERIEILTSQLSFIGAGRIDYDPDASLLNQPINIQFRMGAKGRAAQALNSLRMLTGQQNELGYYEGPTFLNEGTLSTPTSTLAGIVREAVTGYRSGERIELPEEEQPAPSDTQAPPEEAPAKVDPAELLRGLLEGRRSNSTEPTQ